MRMAVLRAADKNHRLKENDRERLRKADWRKVPKNCEKARNNERRADITSDNKIKDFDRDDLSPAQIKSLIGPGSKENSPLKTNIGRKHN